MGNNIDSSQWGESGGNARASTPAPGRKSLTHGLTGRRRSSDDATAEGAAETGAQPAPVRATATPSGDDPFALHLSGSATGFAHNPDGQCNCPACAGLAAAGDASMMESRAVGDGDDPASPVPALDGPKDAGQKSGSDPGAPPASAEKAADKAASGPKDAAPASATPASPAGPPAAADPGAKPGAAPPASASPGASPAAKPADPGQQVSTAPASADKAETPQPGGKGPAGSGTPAPPTITSQTTKTAAGNGDRTRTTVGVGEVIDFTGSAAGTWTASGGAPAAGPSAAGFRWTAPDAPGAITITLTVGSLSATKTITVIAPNALSMVKTSSHALTAGTAGVCMLTAVTVGPSTVSFGNVEWLEVPGPATGVSGYFTRFPAATIFHNPNPSWLGWNDANTGLSDHAAWHAVPPPYSAGSFTWVVPNKYRVAGTGSAGTFFTNTYQVFTMVDATGTMSVSKAGASASRSP